MYAKVTIAQGHLGAIKSGEVGKIYRDSIMPETKQLRGHKGTLLLLDRATGKCISFSVWVTEADLRANENSGHYHKQLVKLGHLFTAPAVREVFEVVSWD